MKKIHLIISCVLLGLIANSSLCEQTDEVTDDNEREVVSINNKENDFYFSLDKSVPADCAKKINAFFRRHPYATVKSGIDRFDVRFDKNSNKYITSTNNSIGNTPVSLLFCSSNFITTDDVEVISIINPDYIQLRYCSLVPECLKSFAMWTKCTVLDLIEVQIVDDAAKEVPLYHFWGNEELKFLVSMPQLKHLILSTKRRNVWEVYYSGNQFKLTKSGIDLLGKIPHLSRLDVGQIAIDDLPYLLEKVPNLESLIVYNLLKPKDLSWHDYFYKYDMRPIFLSLGECSQLQTLELVNVPYIQDDELGYMDFKKLRSVRLHGLRQPYKTEMNVYINHNQEMCEVFFNAGNEDFMPSIDLDIGSEEKEYKQKQIGGIGGAF